jgi:hypothetical protein
LTVHLEKTMLSEKMIEDDLSHVEEGATKSTYKLDVEFERCENKGEKNTLKFIPSSNYYKKKKHSNQPKSTTHPMQSHPSTPRER